MSKTTLTYYMAELIRLASDSDIGFHNSGGTREAIFDGQEITYATIYAIFPFDNKIKTADLSGAQINAFMNSSGGRYYSVRNDMTFENGLYYKVATNDFIFDNYSEFQNVLNPFDTEILILDVFEAVLRNQAESYAEFLISNPIELGSTNPNKIYYLEQRKNYNRIAV